MANLTEGRHSAEFVVWESGVEVAFAREEVTILSGENLVAGAVIAKITASGKYVAWDPAQSAEGDGSTDAVAILVDDVDASAGDVVGTAIVRDAVVRRASLNWNSGQASEIDDAIANLKTKGILVRESV